MADYSRARRICYVTLNHAHPLVKEHIRQGGLAAVLEEGMNGQMIALYDNGHHIPLLWSHLIPASLEGRALHNVQNAMFAASIAYGLDISLENIRQGLRTFDSTFYQAPGRMNVFDEHPFKVILDYAHNPAAVRVICQVADRLDVPGKRILVFTSPGDRRDEDIEAMAISAVGHFDHYVCRQDDNLRGRDHLEIPQMMRQVLLDNGVPEDNVTIVTDEREANSLALSMARAGDLVLMLCDAVARSWKQIIYFQPSDTVLTERNLTANKIDLGSVGFDELSLDTEVELIRDERGVRLARPA